MSSFGVALPVAGQRSLDRAGVHAHTEGLLDPVRQLRRAQTGAGGQLFLGPGEDLLGELVPAVRAGPGRYQPVQPGVFQRGCCLVVGGPGVAERRGRLGDRGAAGLTLRTISYLTCTASRASKKSLARNSGSVTCSGCGFRQRASASAASFGSGMVRRLAMPPPHPDECKDDSAGCWGRGLACEAACRGIFRYYKQKQVEYASPDDPGRKPQRHNPLDIHGVIAFTAGWCRPARGAGPPDQRAPAGHRW